MKNRLEIARELLTNDGSIWINIDDDESHYLKVLCDEIFNRENFIANIVWEKKYSPQNDAKWFSDSHDHILVYAKKKEIWHPNLLPRTDVMNGRYKNPDNDKRGVWKPSGLDVRTYSEEYDYPITTPSGRIVNPPKSRCWSVSKKRFEELVKENRIWFGPDGNSVPSVKRFLTDVQSGSVPLTIWKYNEVGHNQEAKQEIKKVLDNDFFGTPKPERLLNRIIHIGSSRGDIVLDFHLGSGTTAAVAHKMGRQYIGIEQMDYIESITLKRLEKVIGKMGNADGKLFEELAYDEGGISKAVNWRGGGEFVYCELLQYNQVFMERIQAAQSSAELMTVWRAMAEHSFLKWYVNPSVPQDALKDFEDLGQGPDGLSKQKRLLAELLDKNQLYVNLSEIDDQQFQVSAEDKALNRAFYGEADHA